MAAPKVPGPWKISRQNWDLMIHVYHSGNRPYTGVYSCVKYSDAKFLRDLLNTRARRPRHPRTQEEADHE